MISTIKNINDYIIAYVEWEILDKDGQFQNNGDYIYIQNLWVHGGKRYGGLNAELAKKIYEHPFSQKATKVYWQVTRDDNGDKIIDDEDRSYKSKRMSRLLDKEYIYKKLKGVKT